MNSTLKLFNKFQLKQTMKSLIILLLFLPIVFATYDQLLTGYSNVYQESVDADVIIERGSVPDWLEGNFC